MEVCGSGKEALELCKTFQPQMIILDVIMPQWDGPRTFTKIKELPEFNKTPIAFMTSKVMDEDIERYTQLGVCGIIKKPFHPMQLADKVNEIWSLHHETLNSPTP